MKITNRLQGENSIVGAFSLVKDDVPDNAMVAGTPAKIINEMT
uniref:Acetyltransferase n=1 Tax=viral metagenome TaxID=1070528 RepID=A0A6M3LY47_9ZZZZ